MLRRIKVLIGAVGSASLRARPTSAPPNVHEDSCTRTRARLEWLELTAMVNTPGWTEFRFLRLLVLGTRALGDTRSRDRLEATLTLHFAEFHFLFHSSQYNQSIYPLRPSMTSGVRNAVSLGPPSLTFLPLTDSCVTSRC